MGVRAIIWNSNDETMAALSNNFKANLSSKEMEAKALGISPLWAKEVGQLLHIIKSNAQTMVNNLKKAY